jgi:hypothetical protein
VREKITQQLAEICGAALSCHVEDMVTICDQILSGLEEESNVVIRRRRDNKRKRNVSSFLISYSHNLFVVMFNLIVPYFSLSAFNTCIL